MAKSMSPSATTPITPGQMGKFYDLLFAGLRKSGLASEPTQQVLETQGDVLVDEFVTSVRRRVEAMSDLITRRITVNRNRTPQDMLDATGRIQYTDKSVVQAMPRGTGEEVEVVFFKVGRCINNSQGDQLEKEYALRGLVPVDPFSLGAINEADPAFGDKYWNATHWKDAEDRWCYAGFDRWNDVRALHVGRNAISWPDDWWFAGVRQTSVPSSNAYPLTADCSKVMDNVDQNESGGVVAELVHFGRTITSKDAIKEMDARGLRPATIEELITFGNKYSEEPREFPIVALGSFRRGLFGERHVISLYGDMSGSRLRSHWFGDEWDGYCRFIAVRK